MKRLVAAVFLVLLLIILAILWSRRVSIATDYIDRELARRGVQASYSVKRIGFRTQQLENLVIGDPKRLDLDPAGDRKSTRLNSSHGYISYAVFCLKKKKKEINM